MDGPYGTSSRELFETEHAVLVASGIGVTPYASVLQSIMYRFLESKRVCPRCEFSWCSELPPTIMKLKKVGQRVKGSKGQGFKGSRIQGVKGSRIQRVKGSKGQGVCCVMSNRNSIDRRFHMTSVRLTCIGARCSSVVRAFTRGLMGRRIDPSWWTH